MAPDAGPALTPEVGEHLRHAASHLFHASAHWTDEDQDAWDADGHVAEAFGAPLEEVAIELARFAGPMGRGWRS